MAVNDNENGAYARMGRLGQDIIDLASKAQEEHDAPSIILALSALLYWCENSMEDFEGALDEARDHFSSSAAAFYGHGPTNGPSDAA